MVARHLLWFGVAAMVIGCSVEPDGVGPDEFGVVLSGLNTQDGASPNQTIGVAITIRGEQAVAELDAQVTGIIEICMDALGEGGEPLDSMCGRLGQPRVTRSLKSSPRRARAIYAVRVVTSLGEWVGAYTTESPAGRPPGGKGSMGDLLKTHVTLTNSRAAIGVEPMRPPKGGEYTRLYTGNGNSDSQDED